MNGLADVRALRALAGPRPTDELIDQLHAGAQRLETIVSRWKTFPPTSTTMADADGIAEGLRKTLIELRVSQRGGPDAA